MRAFRPSGSPALRRQWPRRLLAAVPPTANPGCPSCPPRPWSLAQRHFGTRGERVKEDGCLDRGTPTLVHFRETKTPHPLLAKPHQQPDFNDKYAMTVNHIWSQGEIDSRLANLYQHRPQTLSDRVMHGIMWTLYRAFNRVTGFKPVNTPVKAVEWRLVVLESFAGVPGFMAAMFRHFRSLRTLQRDHGWIHTLLEEAENERMHLLVCLKMFEAGFVTRCMVLAAQVFMTPWLAMVYAVSPGAVHRFVGYLEETACLTYANIIHQVETPGTPLHDAWAQLPAPRIAKTYWRLPEEALWVDTLKCMFADESNHRDVNHTFATMGTDDPNPFVAKHRHDAVHSWRLVKEGRTADVGCYRTLGQEGADAPNRAPPTAVKTARVQT